jgi:tRNA modification GTPase
MNTVEIEPLPKETIAAISTPYGKGAIAVIRISGPDAFSIVSDLFYPKEKFKKSETGKAIHGYIEDKGVKLDEVLVLKFASPNSYTGEDVVEISCHGGIYITSRLLEMVIGQGARPAEPGEFSLRAFLNGKIDLIQAEAIQELISAKSDRAGRLAIQALRGEVSKEIERIKSELTDILASIAVMIDYPEYEYDEMQRDDLTCSLRNIAGQISTLIETYKKGSMYKNGIKIAIAGKPNVGKSTFLNTFIGKNRAIVTDIPGTTRDAIEEHLEIAGVPVTLIDTAGLRETENIIEKMGQEKTRAVLEEADIVLLILDSNEGIYREDEEILKVYSDKHVIIILNKIDMTEQEKIRRLEKGISHSHVLKASFLKAEGIKEVEEMICNIMKIDEEMDMSERVITQIRQKELLSEALLAIRQSIAEIEAGIPMDICEMFIKNTAVILGGLLGENIDEDVINKVFSHFCLGK